MAKSSEAPPAPPTGALSFERAADSTLIIRLAGSWSLKGGLPSAADVERQVDGAVRISFDTRGLTAWDSSLLTFVTKIIDLGGERRLSIDRAGLPPGIRKLLDLAEAVPERKGARKEEIDRAVLERIGSATVETADATVKALAFLGELAVAFG